jgi:hypothetical protein
MARPPGRPASDKQAATLALLAFAMLIVSLDQYIVVVALPEIGRASATGMRASAPPFRAGVKARAGGPSGPSVP